MTTGSDLTQYEEFVKKLKLDERKQLPDVQGIFISAVNDASPFERQMSKLRMEMLEAAGDSDRLSKLADTYRAAAAGMTSIEVRTMGEVRALLKPNQLEKTAEAFALIGGIFHPPTPRAMGRRGGGGQ
jgi:hypothetical protein